MCVDFHDLFDRVVFEQGGLDALLYAEDYAFVGFDADGGRAELDGFDCVFYLEEATFGGEGVDTAV